MGRFATTWGFPTLGVGTAFDLLGTESQVSPNARRRAQCKGGGGKEKFIYVHTNDCTICRRLSESVVAAFTWNRNLGKSEAKHPIEPHFSQHFPSYPEL